jgi:flagellar biosynthesis/type III secretory pathway protein FliH
MSKYTQFVFQDLSLQSVVNRDANAHTTKQAAMIADAVVQHLETIVPVSNTTESNEPAIDIERLRTESYESGRQDAEAEMRPVIEKLKTEFHFSSELQQKLNLITRSVDLDEQMTKLICDLVQNIARKLYLTLPVDFEQMFLREISNIIRKFYKEGQITVRVHEDMVDRCNNLLQSINLPSHNLDIVVDEDLYNNDCVVEWGESRLEYNQNSIIQEIEKMVEMLCPNASGEHKDLSERSE